MAQVATLTKSADPIAARIADAMRRVPARVEALLADRAYLSSTIAASGGFNESLALRLLRVESELRSFGPSLDSTLAPAFGDGALMEGVDDEPRDEKGRWVDRPGAQDAPHVEIGGGGNAPKGGVHVGGRFSSERYYAGGQFLPKEYPKAQKIARVAAARADGNIAEIRIRKASAGVGGGYWPDMKMAGIDRRVLIGKNPVATADEARFIANEIVRLKSEASIARGMVPHPTEIVNVDNSLLLESYEWSCRAEFVPPAGPIAEDWVVSACSPAVRAAVGPVTAEIIPVVTGEERPYVMIGDADSRDGGQVIHVRADSLAHVWAHEFGHLIEESIPAVKRAAMALWKATTGAAGMPARRVSQLSRVWKPDDMVRPGFADPYWGLVPARGATEVVSGGLGAMQRSPGAFFVADPRHFAFILAVLAGDYLP